MRPVICLGCAFWDTIFQVESVPPYGKALASRMVQAASGMATAAAVAVARLGGEVSLWTRIGDDPAGALFLADLAAERVDARHVRQVPGGRTWLSTILVDAAGERLVVPFADPALDPDPGWLPLDAIADASCLLADMRWPDGAEAAFGRARAVGVPTILDADVAPPEITARLLPLADHLLFSAPALQTASREADPERGILRIAAETGAEVVGVTLGPDGAILRRRGDPAGATIAIPAPAVLAVDTLNAGDVWHGAYAYGLAGGWDVPWRARFANVAAAIKCETFGGRAGAPTLGAVLARLGEAAALDSESTAPAPRCAS